MFLQTNTHGLVRTLERKISRFFALPLAGCGNIFHPSFRVFFVQKTSYPVGNKRTYNSITISLPPIFPHYVPEVVALNQKLNNFCSVCRRNWSFWESLYNIPCLILDTSCQVYDLWVWRIGLLKYMIQKITGLLWNQKQSDEIEQ